MVSIQSKMLAKGWKRGKKKHDWWLFLEAHKHKQPALIDYISRWLLFLKHQLKRHCVHKNVGLLTSIFSPWGVFSTSKKTKEKLDPVTSGSSHVTYRHSTWVMPRLALRADAVHSFTLSQLSYESFFILMSFSGNWVFQMHTVNSLIDAALRVPLVNALQVPWK